MMTGVEQFQKAKEGLELILDHFYPDPIWPRSFTNARTHPEYWIS